MCDRRPQLKEEHAPESWRQWRVGGNRPDGCDGQAPKPPVDLVAIQGLAANYDWTWTKKPEKPEDGPRGVMWLRDLLPHDVPEARVLTFEYDSKWLKDPSLVSLRDCADRLIESVLWDRTHLGETKVCRHMARRPLILLGHSFGGLVVKMALVRAAAVQRNDSRYDNYQSFLRSVAGVLFLGTPHAGSNFAILANSWGRFLSKVRYDVSLDLIKLLRPLAVEGGAALDDLEEDFQSIRREDYLSELITYYFWEGKKVKIYGFRTVPVVTKKSACYGAPPGSCVDMDTDHKGLNKFGSPRDDNYFKVFSRLRSICLQAHSIVERRLSRLQYDANNPAPELQAIREWLSPPDNAEILSRLQNARLDGTCTWSLQNEALRLWLHPDEDEAATAAQRRSVWISGKPGSGKSVVAAYLHSRAEEVYRQRTGRDVQCSGTSDTPSCDKQKGEHKFAALYSPLQQNQSILAALRGLIDDLLRCGSSDSDLQSTVFESMSKHPRLTLKGGIELLTSLLRKFHIAYVTVDNVDECLETKDVAHVLRAILKVPGARLLFAARKDIYFLAEIKELLGAELALVDITNHNHRDIAKFIQHSVSLMAADRSSLFSPQLMTQVQDETNKKADGMFYWAQLILRDLGRAGITRGDILQILEQFPSDLNKTYSRTLTAMGRLPLVQQFRVGIALRWLVATSQPLPLSAMSMVIKIWERRAQVASRITEFDESPDWDGEELLAFLSPLVEVSQSSGPKSIRIFHHSFREWITQRAQFLQASNQIHDHCLTFSLQGAHFYVAVVCLQLLSSDKYLLDYLREVHSPSSSASPLVTYAAENWSYHARMSGGSDGQKIQPENVDALSGLLILLQAHIREMVGLSATAIAALCSVLSQIRPESLQHLLEAIAVRDLQSALLDAAESISELRSSVTALEEPLKTFCRNADHAAPRFHDVKDKGYSDDRYDTLDWSLMSPTTLDIARRFQDYPDLSDGFREHFHILSKAFRHLREVSVLLAVEPVRSYIYDITGDHGVSPLPILAYTTAAMDVLFIMAAPQHPTTADLCDFRLQFQAMPSHPLYGPVTAARYELQKKRSIALGEEFYLNHIADTFQLRRWEWRLLHLTTIILDIRIDGSAAAQDTILDHWLINQVKSRRLRPRGEALHETMKFLKLKKSDWRTARVGDVFMAAASALYVYFMRLLTILSPPLQTVAISCVVMVRARSRLAIPILRQLIRNPTSLPTWIAVGLYAIRLQWFSGMLSLPRRTPVADLISAFRDPFNYTAASKEWVWVNTLHAVLLVLAEVALGLSAFLDAVQIVHPGIAPYIPRAVLGSLWTRVSSLSKRYTTATLVVAPALVGFLRLVFLERAVCFTAYLAYDITKASAMLVNSSTSVWEGLIYLASAFLPLVIMGEYGVTGLAIFVFQTYIVTLVWRSFTLPFAIRLALYHALMTIFAPLMPVLQSGYTLVQRSSEIFAIFRLGTRSLNPTAAVAVVAVAMFLLLTIFFYIMMDPLHLRRARERTARAERIARRVSGVEDPLAYLQWKRSRTPNMGHVPLSSLYGRRRR